MCALSPPGPHHYPLTLRVCAPEFVEVAQERQRTKADKFEGYRNKQQKRAARRELRCGSHSLNLNPQPSALNPQPSTLNTQPSTLNPQP
jgi:hypothetical protein